MSFHSPSNVPAVAVVLDCGSELGPEFGSRGPNRPRLTKAALVLGSELAAPFSVAPETSDGGLGSARFEAVSSLSG